MQMTQRKLDEMVGLHEEWLKDGRKGERIDSRDINLNGANLRNADLRYAYLPEANLAGADLRDAKLSCINLDSANLKNADLRYAYLPGAVIVGANLVGANLRGADLRDSDLRDTDLAGVDLRDTDLRNANLAGTDLRKTQLNWVNWHGARGIKVYIASLQSSRENAELAYIPSLNVATTGCFQGTLEELKVEVKTKYKKNDIKIYKKYKLAIEYIEAQIRIDKEELLVD